MIDGSSTDNSVVKQIKRYFTRKKKCLVILDSNHTHEHVLNELKIYSKFVSKNSFIIVFDTHCEFLQKANTKPTMGKGTVDILLLNSS